MTFYTTVYYTLIIIFLHYIQKILYRHVFPVLCLECTAPETATSALCPLLTLIDYATRDEYIDIILPEFTFIMNAPKSVQVCTKFSLEN